jgi:hypothetical protein
MGWLIMWVLKFERLYEKPNFDNKKLRVCNTYIEKLVYAQKGNFMKANNLIIYKNSNMISP